MAEIPSESGYNGKGITKEEWRDYQFKLERDKELAKKLREASKDEEAGDIQVIEFKGSVIDDDGTETLIPVGGRRFKKSDFEKEAKDIEASRYKELMASGAKIDAHRNPHIITNDPVSNELQREKALQADIQEGTVERNPEHPFKYKYKEKKTKAN